jgi:hypothetical protein
MTDIRECPCCFGKAKYQRTGFFASVGKIVCTKCGLQTPVAFKAVSIRRWNRRFTLEVRHE